MPDGSTVRDTGMMTFEGRTEVIRRADRVLALVAALDLLDANDAAFCQQKAIRTTLTGMAFDEAALLTEAANA